MVSRHCPLSRRICCPLLSCLLSCLVPRQWHMRTCIYTRLHTLKKKAVMREQWCESIGVRGLEAGLGQSGRARPVLAQGRQVKAGLSSPHPLIPSSSHPLIPSPPHPLTPHALPHAFPHPLIPQEAVGIDGARKAGTQAVTQAITQPYPQAVAQALQVAVEGPNAERSKKAETNREKQKGRDKHG